MNREKVTEELVTYFKSDQWQQMMHWWTQTEEELYHLHLYVENKIEEESLIKLLDAYFRKKGLDLDRKPVRVPITPEVGCLMAVQPTDPERARYHANFELFYTYSPDVAMKPATVNPGKEGAVPLLSELKRGNVFAWGKNYMDEYLKQFHFKCVGPKEEREIRKYFESAHWRKWLSLVRDPKYSHVHGNVEINFDPWILKMYAVEAMKEIGWKVDYVVQNVFVVRTIEYVGKLIFIVGYPEGEDDICWRYNPDVVIRPAQTKYIGVSHPDGDISFDVALQEDGEKLLRSGEWITLTDEMIEDVLARV